MWLNIIIHMRYILIFLLVESCAFRDSHVMIVTGDYSYDDSTIIAANQDCVIVRGLVSRRFFGDAAKYANIYVRRVNQPISDSHYVIDRHLNLNNLFNNVPVNINSSGYGTMADSNGMFLIFVEPDKYYFEIQAMATRLKTKPVYLRGGHKYTFIFNLGSLIVE